MLTGSAIRPAVAIRIGFCPSVGGKAGSVLWKAVRCGGKDADDSRKFALRQLATASFSDREGKNYQFMPTVSFQH
jgi:hypothetical protein